MVRKIIFSDVDGTLVHLENDLHELGVVSQDGRNFVPVGGQGSLAIRPLPPSSTGLKGYISEGTLKLVRDLRDAGHIFVLISGARSSTVMERLPFLPAADAIVMENGGRIFFEDSKRLAAAPLIEDLDWRATQVAAGPAYQIATAPADRTGALWDLFRRLDGDGWACDAKSYSTDFRVSVKKSKGKTEADLRKIIAALPADLTCSFNLGSADFYPATSGKDLAARYLMRKFGVSQEHSVSIGDDDNDLALAALVRHTYIPGFTADSVRAAVAKEPSSFTVAEVGGFLGTEELLEQISTDLRSPVLPSGAIICSIVAMTAAAILLRQRRVRLH